MVQRIACVLPQVQRWMQVAESGLDRELLVFRRRQHLKDFRLKDFRRIPAQPQLPVFRSSVPEQKDPMQRKSLIAEALLFQLLNYQMTHLPNRAPPPLIPISKALSSTIPIPEISRRSMIRSPDHPISRSQSPPNSILYLQDHQEI
jgi:hypothetical protein